MRSPDAGHVEAEGGPVDVAASAPADGIRVLAPRTTGAEVAMRWLPTLFQNPYADRILTEFRWQAYLRANPDVAANAKDAEAALRHFYFNGYYERRIFDRDRLKGFDGGYYRERHPELGLVDDAEAQVHYCYLGYYEGRPANRDEAWLLDVDLHVFQMGKVGSHSIAAALDACGSRRHVIQLHWMADFHRAHPHLRLPYRRLLHGGRTGPVQVISGTREIVSWGLASLFQYFGHGVQTLEEAREMVELRFWETCEAGLTWFDHRYFCGLDVYATPFPHGEGAVRIAHEAIDLLIYRQEDMPRLSATMAGFLGLPGFTLGRANDGENKAYSGLYREFLQRFRLPGNLLARLYDAPMMRHFYSDDEREAAYRRWVG
jgi:hypothetical protein